MRVHAWRGIGSGYNKFAAEAFLDEVAVMAGKDPVALRLELTKDKPRASAVIYGLSAALIEEFAVKSGAVQATNFDSYPVMRMSDVPEIHTKIITTDNPPSGMGEIGVVTVAPAIANAMFKLTGKRLRHLPMTPDRVKKALA